MTPQSIQKYITGVIVVLLIAIIALSVSFFQLDKAAKGLENAEEQKIESILLIDEMRQSSEDITRFSRSFALTGDQKYKQYFNEVLAIKTGKQPRPENYHRVYWDLVEATGKKPRADGKAESLEALIKKASFSAKEVELLNTASKKIQELATLESAAFTAGTASPQATIQKVFGQEFLNLKTAIMKPIEQAQTLAETRLDNEIADFKAAEVTAEIMYFSAAVISLLAIIALFFLGNKQNKLRLEESTKAREKAEKENEQLNNSVINILQTMHQLSQRDLTVKAPVTEDIIGTVSDSVNALTDETSKVLLNVTDVAEKVNLASNKVREQATIVSQTAETERSKVGQMTNAITTSSNTINQMAGLAEQSNDSARKAALATQDAMDTVQTTVNEMDSIRETISQTEKRIKRLGERSQEISGIVGLINTISERTHVLALNASMQAAVAGEAGRGFAVVAEEVQRLAESSRNATEQIETLVKNIQIDTNETINTVNETISRVVKGSEEAKKAGEQMDRTRNITAELVAQVLQITDSIEQQKETSNMLLESVYEIGLGAEDTSKHIEEQNLETAQLQQAAKELVETVNVFKLPKR